MKKSDSGKLADFKGNKVTATVSPKVKASVDRNAFFSKDTGCHDVSGKGAHIHTGHQANVVGHTGPRSSGAISGVTITTGPIETEGSAKAFSSEDKHTRYSVF